MPSLYLSDSLNDISYTDYRHQAGSPLHRAQRAVRRQCYCWDFIPALGGHPVESSANKQASNKPPAQMWVFQMHYVGISLFHPRTSSEASHSVQMRRC